MDDVTLRIRVDSPTGELILPDHHKVALVSDLDVVNLDQIGHEAAICGRV